MKHSDFTLNRRFRCGDNVWLVTDIGTRTVIAIQVRDDGWMNGPPYAQAEAVFDENDMPGCEPVESGK